MSLRLGLICPSCELLGLSSYRTASMQNLRRQAGAPSRSFAQMQRGKKDQRPSRMALSPSVSRPATPSLPPTPSDKSSKVERSNGPFGGMNRTSVPAAMDRHRRPPPSQETSFSPRSKPSTSPHNPSLRSMPNKGEKRKQQPGDMKALKMQRALTQVSYAQRSSLKTKINEVDSFRDLSLLPSILTSIQTDALKGLVDITPTPIQRLAIPALLDHQKGYSNSNDGQHASKQFLLAAETGSGKTLAYLLPTIDAIKRAETEQLEHDIVVEEPLELPRSQRGPFEVEPPPLSNIPHPSAGRPRAIILVPTAELVDQVGSVFKAFSHTVKLRVALISAAYSANIIRNRLFKNSGIDIVISTPHLIHSITQSDPNILSRVSHLVIDEADSLFDRSFAPTTSAIVDRATPSLEQLILCSATIPRSLDSYLQKRFPEIVRLATPNLHAIPRRVQLSVVDIEKTPYRGNRDLACADAIWQIGRSSSSHESDGILLNDGKRIVVFVNEREKAIELASYLVTKGIDAVALNRDTKEERTGEILSAFTTNSPVSVSGDKTFVQQHDTHQVFNEKSSRILRNVKVLVMTDLGSRGIDTVAVRNVVLYDVPHTSIDFIHRLGRVGRMGRRGRGVILVGRDDRKDIVREVREGMFRGQALI